MNTKAIIGIARYELVRVARDRLTLFFLIVLPVLVVVIVGSTFGGTIRELPIGVLTNSPDPMTAEVIDRLNGADAVTVTTYDDPDSLRRDIHTGRQLGGIIADSSSGRLRLTLLTDPASSSSQALSSAVQGIVDRFGAELVAADVALDLGAAADPAAAASLTASLDIKPSSIARRAVGDGVEPPDSNFAYTVPSQLVLFVFVSALGAGAALVDLKRLGISRRILSTPTTIIAAVVGLAAARFLLAIAQATLLIGVGAIVFGIEWGDPAGVATLVALYAAAAVGAGLLIGAVASTPDQAMALGIPLAIGLGMLGGAMWPLEIVGDAMRAFGHAAPQAWAMDGWVALIFDRGSITDLGSELAALTGFAVALLTAGSVALTRSLSR